MTIDNADQEYHAHADSGYHGMAPLPNGDPSNILNTMYSDYPLKGIGHPHPHDVLCGRGGQSNSHPGNAQWRMLVAANKELYVTLPKKQKMLLSQSIVNAVRSQNPPGRFLQKDGAAGAWYDVGDKRAQEKTSQALREGAPEIRTKLHTTTITSPNPGAAAVSSSASVASTVPSSTDHVDSEEGRIPISGAPPPPVASDSVVNELSPSQHHPPRLVEVVSSSVTSIGSSSTHHHTNIATQQHAPPPQLKATPNTFDQPQPMYYGAGHSSYSHGSHHHPNPQHMYSVPPQHSQMVPPIDYDRYPTMAPPSVISSTPIPPQGPITDRKSKKDQQHPQSQQQESTSNQLSGKGVEEVELVPREIDEVYIPTLREPVISPTRRKECPKHSDIPTGDSARGHEYDGFDDTPIVPPALQGNEYSFGSTLMMSDLEQARLMNGASFGTAMSYGYTGNQNPDKRSTAGPVSTKVQYRDPTIENHVPLPVDGGLEPVGFSFGSVMSTTTGIAFNDTVKLEGAGLSFGSMMSYAYTNNGVVFNNDQPAMPTTVDGGLEDIGTSMGSLTLDPEERQRIIESAKEDMMNGECDNPHMPPPTFHATKSKGNLLDCSDSDDSQEESEVKSQQLTTQKSLEWERMQAALAGHASATASSSYCSNNYKNYNHAAFFPSSESAIQNHLAKSSSDKMAPLTLNIPTTPFDRNLSQMSAISVNDDFDKDYQDQPFDHSAYPYGRKMDSASGIYHNYAPTYDTSVRQREIKYPARHRQLQSQEDTSWFDPEPFPIQQSEHFIIPSSVNYSSSGRKTACDYYDNSTHAPMPPPPRTKPGESRYPR